MARRPKKGKELPENIAQLVGALDFVQAAASEEGNVGQTNCIVRDRMVVVNNGLYSMGAPIPDDVVAAPHVKSFYAALQKCDASVAITIRPNGWINVKSGKFSANIVTVPIEDIPYMPPDPPLVAIPPAVFESMAKVSGIAKENAPRIILASVLLRANSAAATTGTMLLEAWHGTDLPTMALPKKVVDKLLKVGRPATAFGYSGSSATFYFDDGSYLRTQLYQEAWPDIDRLLNVQTAAVPMPEGFWQAFDTLSDFFDQASGFVIFGEDAMQSKLEKLAGASYELPSFGMQGKAIAADLLDECRDYMETADFITHPDRVFFFGASKGVRGIIMHGRPQ